MTGQTHAVVGANAVWIAVLTGTVDQSTIPLALVGVVAGLLPDLDASAAKIHFIGGGLLGTFRGIMNHRGFMHSLLVLGILSAMSFVFLRQYHPLIPYAFALGYLSHLIIDGFNFAGVPYLLPFKAKFHLVPKFLRTPAKGIIDQLLFVSGLLGIVMFFLNYYNTSIPMFLRI